MNHVVNLLRSAASLVVHAIVTGVTIVAVWTVTMLLIHEPKIAPKIRGIDVQYSGEIAGQQVHVGRLYDDLWKTTCWIAVSQSSLIPNVGISCIENSVLPPKNPRWRK